MPTSLMGLSPQEISQISAGRRSTESGQLRQIQSLIGALGDQKTAGIAREKMDLAREKFEHEKNPPMIQMKTEDGQIYEVPKAAQAEGIRAKATVDNLYQTGRIDKAKHDAWMKPVVISIPDGAGGWIPYEVPSGMLQETAAATKNLQAMRVSGVEESRRREAFEALGGKTIGDIKNIPMADMLGIRPEALSTMISKAELGTGVDAQIKTLKPEERRKLIRDHTDNAALMIKEGSKTSDASIQSYNDQSRSLGYPSMMFRHSTEPKSFYGVSVPLTGGDDLIEVKLPVTAGKQMTPDIVYTDAKKKGISVSQRLQEIYEGMKIIEQARQIGKK